MDKNIYTALQKEKRGHQNHVRFLCICPNICGKAEAGGGRQLFLSSRSMAIQNIKNETQWPCLALLKS